MANLRIFQSKEQKLKQPSNQNHSKPREEMLSPQIIFQKKFQMLYSLIVLCMSFLCLTYVIDMYLYATRMSFVCHSQVIRMPIVCQEYVIRMYSYVIRMQLVCACMSPVCHSYILVSHPYVTCMCLYVTRMSLLCTRISLVYHLSVVLP